MSTILNSISEVIAKSIKVEVKNPVNRGKFTRYPILVTDTSDSFTSGWFIQYTPFLNEQNVLRNNSETFDELYISRFSELEQLILTANHYFLQGFQVEKLQGGRTRAIYEPNPSVRLTVTSQTNSVSVVVTITDEKSPFHMLSINFTVTTTNGVPYVRGSEKYWDRNTDMFLEESNANFAPRKGRFYRVYQQQNTPATLRAKIAVNNGQYAINYDGTFAVDTNASSPEYIQVISNEYKALAYLYEQAIMKVAFDMAISQGLPTASNNAPFNQGQASMPTPPGNFVPAFAVPGITPVSNVAAPQNAGVPNPNPPAPIAPQVAPHAPNLSFPAPDQSIQQPSVDQQVPVHVGTEGEISKDDLPWENNKKEGE